MIITILTDDADCWYVPFGRQLTARLGKAADGRREHDVAYVFDKQHIRPGDVCFLLSCTRLVPAEFLARNRNNVVVHASDLPQGKGFSPLAWQVLEGRDEIVLTLFEVVADVDAGPYYFKDRLRLAGHELLDELRRLMAEKINAMCVRYIAERDVLSPTPQSGPESFYTKRRRSDDALDVDRTLREQFNRLRIVDNERWPAFFDHLGFRYTLRIEKQGPTPPDQQ